MSRIRSKYSRIDRKMMGLLDDAGVKYVMYPKMFGNPDFLLGRDLVVFCDSAFWHGRNWRTLKAKLELSPNPDYWVSHIMKNRARDKFVNRKLFAQNIRVLRFWDDDILRRPDDCLQKIIEAIRVPD